MFETTKNSQNMIETICTQSKYSLYYVSYLMYFPETLSNVISKS